MIRTGAIMAKTTPSPGVELVPAPPTLLTARGQATVTSIQVAQHFGKQHKNVLQSIRSLECSDEFTELNFQLSDFTDPTGRKLPCYLITKDGFAMLAFGFTGKEAARWREAYINAFNEMERRLRALEVNPSAFDLQALPRVSNKQMEQARKKSNELLRDVLTAKTMEEKRQHYRFLVRSNSSVGIDTDSMEALGIERPKLQIQGGAA